MNVLLVVPDVAEATGGIAMVGRSIARLLARKARTRAITFRLYSIRGPASSTDEFELASSAGDSFRHFNGSVPRFAAAVLQAMALWADVVVFAHLGPASLSAAIPNRKRPRIITFVHGREVWKPLGIRHRKALQCSHNVVANTHFTAKRARSFNPWLGDVTVCHLGIPSIASRNNSGEAYDASGSRDVLIVGRMVLGEPGKGHAQLIHAMKTLVSHVPSARLIIVGDGSGKEHYQQVARDSGAASFIRFLGFLGATELSECYRHSYVFAMPSVQDGFGLVYLEAMRAGLPCITSDVDGGQEVVAHNESGLHVRIEDPMALTSALLELLSNVTLRDRLAEGARLRFERHFTEQRFHDRFWSLLEIDSPR